MRFIQTSFLEISHGDRKLPVGSVTMKQSCAWLLLVVIALFTGCASSASSVNNLMQSWVGHTSTELMAGWGPPTQIIDNPAGGKAFVYCSRDEWTSPGSPGTPAALGTSSYTDEKGFHMASMEIEGARAFPSLSTTSYRTRTFFVNEKGIITSWSWQGV
jgi:hypothetical protein